MSYNFLYTKFSSYIFIYAHAVTGGEDEEEEEDKSIKAVTTRHRSSHQHLRASFLLIVNAKIMQNTYIREKKMNFRVHETNAVKNFSKLKCIFARFSGAL